jgi:hypothetical protein
VGVLACFGKQRSGVLGCEGVDAFAKKIGRLGAIPLVARPPDL